MIDRPRRSVDVPITKTLIALRRVKSLKDPSMSVNEGWDTESVNGISMQLKHEDVMEDSIELESHLGKSMLTVAKQEVIKRETQTEMVESECECESESSEYENEHDLLPVRRLIKYKERLTENDLLSRSGTPSLSMNEVMSSHSNSLFANEDFRFMGQKGCGVTCCWTRTPKFRVLGGGGGDGGGDGEILPLLPVHEMRKQISYKEKQRSLDQKFEPKSFDDLVGQNVVVKSLTAAISTRRIASLYLFHGARGTGKTSAARLFAASLNCLSLEEHKPCGSCQECVHFYCGRSSDVKEIDASRINRGTRMRSLLKDASNPSRTGKFKVFILDECHLLEEESWITFLNNLGRFPSSVIFIMITPDIEKIPRSIMTRSQQFHFPKIKDSDISRRLEDICVEEGLTFEQEGLDFIASTANGSLRDANMMLDQLSLLGEQITLELARELIGVVSDDELLVLLDMALSSDSSSTVIRARELMSSRIDPMQLVSQLANLIMDLLAGKGQDASDTRRSFSRKHSSDADAHRLNHALKVLSDTEKQLRVSKNQTTWLTAALLQLSSSDSSSLDGNYSRLLHQNQRDSNVDTPNSMMNLQCYSQGVDSLQTFKQEDRFKSLEYTWKRAVELCQPTSFRNFLRTRGKLSSLTLNQGIAVAELEFYQSDHVSKAEKFWKTIACSLQSVMGRNVEIRIVLAPGYPPKDTKLKRVSLALFNCSKRMQPKTQSWSISGDILQSQPIVKNNAILVPSSDCGCRRFSDASRSDLGTALRSKEGNVLRTATNIDQKPLPGVSSSPASLAEDLFQEIGYFGNYDPTGEETKEQQRCFPKSLWSQKKSLASNSNLAVRLPKEQETKHQRELNHFHF